MRRTIFLHSRVTWGSLIGLSLGWVGTWLILKSLGKTSLSHGFIVLTGLVGAAIVLLSAFVEFRIKALIASRQDSEL